MSVITDNQVITILRAILVQGLTDQSLSFPIAVKQAFQTKNANAGNGAVVYIHKHTGAYVGWPGTRDVFNETNDDYDTTTTFQDRVTYRFTAYTLEDAENPAYMSANNILELAARIMQTPQTVSALQLSNISMQRIQAIRQAYFDDDRKLFEQSPTFDIVLSYEQTIASTVPKAFPVDLEINRI